MSILPRLLIGILLVALLSSFCSAADYYEQATPQTGFTLDGGGTQIQGVNISTNASFILKNISTVELGGLDCSVWWRSNNTRFANCKTNGASLCDCTNGSQSIKFEAGTTYFIMKGLIDGVVQDQYYKSGFTYPVQTHFFNYTSGAARVSGVFTSKRTEIDSIYAISVQEIASGGGSTSAPSTPSLPPPTPAANYRSNVNFSINCSNNGTDVLYWIYINNFTYWKNVSERGTHYYNVTTNQSDGSWEYRCQVQNRTNGLFSNNITLNFWIDTVSPTITLNPTNSFNISNKSMVNQYGSIMPINITFKDETSLYGILVNITKGFLNYWNYSNESITQTSQNITSVVNITGWPAGVYDINLTCSDTHTAQLIDRYEASTFFNTVTFNTAENNKVDITGYGSYSAKFEKEPASYAFGFDYILPLKDRTFRVKAESGFITYLPDSPYQAHFVICQRRDCSSGGNWVDFEGLGKANVKQVGKLEYEVTFLDLTPSTSIIAHSIGGLNIKTENYKWYRGIAQSTFINPTLSGSYQTIYLNCTQDATYVNDLNAHFIYNGTQKDVTKTSSVGYINFASTVWIPDGNQYYNFTWYVNVTQTTGNYTFNVSDTQQALKGQLNITVYEEKNKTLLAGPDITIYITKEESIVLNTSSGIAISGNLSIGEHRVEAEGALYPRRGIFVTITNFTQNVYLFLLSDIAGNNQIDYTIRDRADHNIENVRISWYRIYNGTTYTVAQYDTDYAGQAQLFQDQIYEYPMTLFSPSYPLKTINLVPLQTAYLIRMDENTSSNYINVYEGMTYSIKPSASIFNVTNQFVNFTFSIYSNDNTLQWFGIQVSNTTYACNPASCISNQTTAGYGGEATLGVNISQEGYFELALFYKRTGFEPQQIQGDMKYGRAILSFLFGTVADRFAELSSGIHSPALKAVIASFGVVTLCVIAAQFGVVGAGLIIAALFGTVFFVMVGFINLFVGFAIAIVGVLAFMIAGRDD